MKTVHFLFFIVAAKQPNSLYKIQLQYGTFYN